MARWELKVPEGTTTEAYYGQLYGNYAQMLKGQGVSGQALSDALSRYSVALQRKLQIEPENLEVGRLVAQDPIGYGVKSPVTTTPFRTMEDVYRYQLGGWSHSADFTNQYLGINTHGSANNTFYLKGVARRSYEAKYDADMIRALNEYETRQKALDNARRAEQAAHFQGTSQEAMNELHNTGYDSRLSDYFRNQEEHQIKIAKKQKVGQKYYIFDENGNKYEVRGRKYHNMRPGDVVNNSQFKLVESVKPKVPVTSSTLEAGTEAGAKGATKAGAIPNGSNPSTIEFNAEPAPNAPRPNSGAEAEGLGRVVAEDAGAGARTTVETITETGARTGAETVAETVAETGTKSTAETITEAGAKAGKSGSGKGKIIGLTVAALAAGAAILFGAKACSDNKKQLPPVENKPEQKPEQESKPQPVQQPEESNQAQPSAPENEATKAVKGSHEYGYAELELISEHLGQEGYRPSRQEITDRMMEIIERENKTLEDAKENDKNGRNRHSVTTLKVGDDIQVSSELKKVIDKATQELKEAHKDNPNYQVTWTELKAKVKEIVARQN